MKKLMLIVAVFLVGAATQTKANQLNNVEHNPTYGCNHADQIQFVENGILYTIGTDGSFAFDVLDSSNYNKGKGKGKGHKNKYWKRSDKKHGHYSHGGPRIIEDRFGRIRAINKTYITYNRNGAVENIGSVPMYYHRGSLVQVGKMELVYNRFGEIRSTIGHVNKENKKFWHDDWYVYNDRYNVRDNVRDNDDSIGRRLRTK